MKRTMKTMFSKTTAGMLALALTFVVTAVSCFAQSGGTVDKKLNGTWANSINKELTYKLANGNYENGGTSGPSSKGTYSTKDGKIIFSQTHFYDLTAKKWVAKDEMDEASAAFLFKDEVFEYTVDGNTLKLISDDEVFSMEQTFVKEK